MLKTKQNSESTLEKVHSLSALEKFIIEKNNKKNILDKGYTENRRLMEKTFIFLFAISFICNVYITYSHLKLITSIPLIISIILLFGLMGILYADLISGIVHWLADTYGEITWPIVGIFIHSFREHHVDSTKITKYDWIGTNGDNCMVVFLTLWIPFVTFKVLEEYFYYKFSNIFKSCVYTFWILQSIFVAVTNQIHKASHQFRPHWFWKLLQDHHIILTKKTHNIHHVYPFDKNYTITTGWLNPLLNKINFWRSMEYIIEKITGQKARIDDMKWNSHLEFLKN